ncbi:monofunctional biosynthetic peptidoglycan transglycosylase [Pedobacter deserti]|uniref:monofunctional biosynthetic peptidoglycan transglycosylase n=1 Tax=Pedobacter deserti TaxID=2817382 RepID=UPI00351F6B01
MKRSKSKSKSTGATKVVHIALKILLWFVTITVLWVFAYRFVNPPITILMIQRNAERDSQSKPVKMQKKWRDLEDISVHMRNAVIAAEDQRFLTHWGFDLKAIENAYTTNKKGKRLKGGSTITQQTAKNVFLWPGRSWIRKGFEAYFSVLIEVLWSKKRILEVYLNVIEMGDGIYGAEAASQSYFDKSSNKLTRAQAALIAACLPNPRRWSPKKPTSYILRRQYLIMKNMRRLGIPKSI